MAKQQQSAVRQMNSALIHQSIEVQRTFSGPLPPPDILKQYDSVVPGMADRLLQMAEKQQGHRQSLESTVIGSEVSRSKLGMLFGFTVAITGIVSGAVLVGFGRTLEGSLFAGVTLATLAGVFVYGSQTRRHEREQKAKIMMGEGTKE